MVLCITGTIILLDLLGGLRSTMEGERAPFLFGHAGINRRKKRAIGEEEDGYKYPLSPNDHLRAAVPHCGSASLQVRQCRTTQDSKGKSEV